MSHDREEARDGKQQKGCDDESRRDPVYMLYDLRGCRDRLAALLRNEALKKIYEFSEQFFYDVEFIRLGDLKDCLVLLYRLDRGGGILADLSHRPGEDDAHRQHEGRQYDLDRRVNERKDLPEGEVEP